MARRGRRGREAADRSASERGIGERQRGRARARACNAQRKLAITSPRQVAAPADY